MKILCSADIHSHVYKTFNKITDNTGSSRLDQISYTLDYMKNYCVENGIDQMAFAGDMFETRGKVNTLVFNTMYDKFKEISDAGINILAIPGNHDDLDNSDLPQHSLHAFKDIKNMSVVDDLSTAVLDDLTEVTCIRYSKNTDMLKETINSVGDYFDGSTKILMAHVGVDGGVVGSGNYPLSDSFSLEDLRPDYFDWVILGHFHKPQLLAENVFYCGSPIQHSFSDEGEDRGFFVIDTDDKKYIKFEVIPNPKFITVTENDISKYDFQELADEGHYVRLQIKESNLHQIQSSLPENLQYKVELQREYKEENRVDVRVGMSPEDVIRKFAEQYNPDAVDKGLDILKEVQGQK